MTTLEDLYYGNISPCEHDMKRGSRMDKLVKLICKNEESLMSTLTEQQKETFEKFKDCQSEICDLTARQAFTDGFILSILLKRAGCKRVRFHDLRHTFATMALENGMDVKTLSATIGHVSAATTLDIYSHMTDTMQMQAAVSIDRKIGGTNAQMPVVEQTPKESEKTPVNAPCAPQNPIPNQCRERYARAARDAYTKSTTTSGKAASSHACRTASERNSTSTLRRKSNAKSNSPR